MKRSLKNTENKFSIVFIENYSTVMIYKIARLFRKKGYKTILIRMREPNEIDKSFYKDAYDSVIDLNLFNKKYFFKTIKSFFKSFFLSPSIIIGRAPPNIPIAIFRIIFWKTPFIYFPYDLHVHWADSIKSAKEIRKLSMPEIKAEKFCFEHSDGIMHKGAPEELNSEYINKRILGDNVKLPGLRIAFHPYCSREFIVPLNKNKLSKKDKEIHFVWVASAGKQSKENYIARFNECKHLIKCRIHVHLYLNSNIKDDKGSALESFFEEYKNFANIRYFHIEDAKDPKELIKEISKYDFGVTPPLIEYYDFDLDRKFGIGNKIATYFEAGLSFFYRKDVEFLDRTMKNYKLELIWPENMKNLKKIIKKLDYKELEKKIIKARQDFLMEKHFPELEKFVEKVTESKKIR